MSQIAQALAKAKERTGHTTAPFMTPGVTAGQKPASPDRVAAVARKARNAQLFWLILGCVSLPLTGFVLWSQLKADAPVAVVPASPASAATSSAAAPAGSSVVSPSAVRPSSASAPASGPAPTASQRAEIVSLVASLPITAVTPGDPPRIMVAGRVVRAGQSVEGELTFVGLADGQLRFTDARGAVYTRYY